MLQRSLVAVLPALALVAPPLALAQDVDAMAQWTSLTIVHYSVVGEFSGELRLLSFTKAYPVSDSALVTDRVEIEFDWDQTEMKLAGEPVVRNFPTKTGEVVTLQGCPGTKIEGPFEFATILEVKDVVPHQALALVTKTDYPGGATPRPGPESGTALCGHAWDPVAPQSETKDIGLGVSPAVALAMPGVLPISPDGKSLIVEENGWTWTITPTPVK